MKILVVLFYFIMSSSGILVSQPSYRFALFEKDTIVPDYYGVDWQSLDKVVSHGGAHYGKNPIDVVGDSTRWLNQEWQINPGSQQKLGIKPLDTALYYNYYFCSGAFTISVRDVEPGLYKFAFHMINPEDALKAKSNRVLDIYAVVGESGNRVNLMNDVDIYRVDDGTNDPYIIFGSRPVRVERPGTTIYVTIKNDVYYSYMDNMAILSALEVIPMYEPFSFTTYDTKEDYVEKYEQVLILNAMERELDILEQLLQDLKQINKKIAQ